MTLILDDVSWCLRFWRPQSLKIEEGFPSPTNGMIILDVSNRNMEGIGIKVHDFEGSQGAVTFWAANVEDLNVEHQT